MFDSW